MAKKINIGKVVSLFHSIGKGENFRTIQLSIPFRLFNFKANENDNRNPHGQLTMSIYCEGALFGINYTVYTHNMQTVTHQEIRVSGEDLGLTLDDWDEQVAPKPNHLTDAQELEFLVEKAMTISRTKLCEFYESLDPQRANQIAGILAKRAVDIQIRSVYLENRSEYGENHDLAVLNTTFVINKIRKALGSKPWRSLTF